MEATWGWYWAADVIAECGARLHLAHPLGIAGYDNRRVKNDVRDATLLADLLRMGRLPEAWVAPPEVRELREDGPLPAQAVAAAGRVEDPGASDARQGRGDPRAERDLAVGGQRWLDELHLGDAYTIGSSRCAI